MISRIFKNMLLAQIVSSAAINICMLVDSIMIGQYLGVDAMAAYGLASPVLFVFAAFGALLSTGIQVMCSRSIAAGDKSRTNRFYTASILLAVIVSLTVVALLYIFTDPLCSILGATKGTDVFVMTGRYLRGFMFGAPAFLCAQIFVPYLQLANRRNRLVVAVSLMTVSDIIMDILNVKVINGGIFGMGVASALSYYVAIAVALVYLLSKRSLYRLVPKSVIKDDWIVLLKNGIPTAVNQICYTLQVFALNQILISSGHSDGVAVYSVLSTVGSLCFSVGSGCGSVALTLAGILYSEEDRHSLSDLVRVFVRCAVFIDVILAAVFFVFAKPIVNLFLTEAPHALRMGTFAMRMFIVCLIPSSVNSSFKNYYQGIGKIWLAQMISVLQNFVYITLFAFVLNLFFGTDGVWLSFVLGEICTLVTFAAVIWKKQGKISLNPSVFAFFDGDFGVAEKDMIDFPINSAEEASEAASLASKFCFDRTGDSQKSMSVALCVEELCTNVIRHGFSDGKKHSMLLRVLYKEGNCVVALRDDCKVFDPVSYRRKLKNGAKILSDGAEPRVGLNLVFTMAKDVTYVDALGLNNLTITI